jgi:hypothetical protein
MSFAKEGEPVISSNVEECLANGREMSRYNTDYEANCLAHPYTTPERPVGPCITSVLDLRDQKNPLEGFVIEDCAVPQALSPLVIPILEYLPDQVKPSYYFVQACVKAAARLGSKVFGPYFPKRSVSRTGV